jgi:hypothetical protein
MPEVEAIQCPTCGTEIVNQRPSGRLGPLLWLARRSRRFWIGTVATLIFYIASFTLAIWIDRQHPVPEWSQAPLQAIYWPIIWPAMYGPEPVKSAIRSYIALWTDADP